MEVAGDAGQTVVPEGPHVLQTAHPVVATGEDFEDRLRGRSGCAEAPGQQADQRLGTRHERLDALGVGPLGVLGQLDQQSLGLGLDLLSGPQHQGLLEGAEAHGPGEVADGRIAQLGSDHQPVQDFTDIGAGTLRQLPRVEPAA